MLACNNTWIVLERLKNLEFGRPNIETKTLQFHTNLLQQYNRAGQTS